MSGQEIPPLGKPPPTTSQTSSSDLFPCSPGFAEALASLPMDSTAQAQAQAEDDKGSPSISPSKHPYADALDLSSPLTTLQPSFPSTWAKGKDVFAAANRKRKRSASPVGRIGFGFRNSDGRKASTEGDGGSGRYAKGRKATVDDITVTSSGQATADGGPSSSSLTLDRSTGAELQARAFETGDNDEIMPITAYPILGPRPPFIPAPGPKEEPEVIQGRGNIGEDGTAGYIDSDAYGGSKFGGIGEYLRRRRMKLQIQNKAIADIRGGQKPQIFEGLYLYINGYVKPSLETCREMIMAHGGTYIPYLDRKSMITHIIATTLTPSKHLEFARYKVATPQWLVESAACGKLLDWRDFKLVAGGGVEESLRGGLGGWMKETQGETQASSFKKILTTPHAKERSSGLTASASEIQTNWDHDMEDVEADQHATDLAVFRSAMPEPPEDEGVAVVIDSKAEPPSGWIELSPAPKPEGPAPFLRNLSPSSLRSVVAPTKGQAPPMTTDPTTFEMTVASGYAKYQENQDAKRLMQDKEWRGMHTAVNEGFLEGYYQNSRLHHLSAWKAELKVLVAQAQKEAESSEVVQKLAPHASQENNSLSLATSVLPRASPRKGGTINTTTASATGTRAIFHVDFDAFFVSCGLATRPELKGKPVVVCHSQGGGDGKKATNDDTPSRVVSDRGQASTSEIASCSYEARACGVRNGMSLGQARKLCPNVQTIPYEFETYKKFSLSFYTILMAYADELQAVSVDEALIDVSSRVAALAQAPPAFESISSAPEDGSSVPEGADSAGLDSPPAAQALASVKDWAKELAETIRSDVRAATGCEVSIGIAENIMLARLATRHAKPAGSFHLTIDLVWQFLRDLDIGELPGFAYQAKKKIEGTFGDSTCGALLAQSKSSLQTCLGPKSGDTLYNFIRGVDDRKLEPHKERKSVSAEVNYGIRFISTEEAEKFLCDLSEEVGRRLKAVSRKGRMVTLKVMVRHPDAPIEAPKFMGHGVCNVFNKSMTVSDGRNGPTDDGNDITKAVLSLYRCQDFDSTELRGIGIQMQKLEGGTEDVVREVGQGVLHFGKLSDGALRKSVPSERALTPPPIVEQDDSDNADLVIDAGPALRSKTRRDPKSMTRIIARPKSPTPAIIAPPMTSRSKFGYKPRVKALDVPMPQSIDLDIWAFMDEAERQDFRTAWKQKGVIVPLALRAKGQQSEKSERRSIFGKPADNSEGKGKVTTKPIPPKQKPNKKTLDNEELKFIGKRSITPKNGTSSASESEIPQRKKKLAAHATSEIEGMGINVDFFRNLPEELAAEVWEGERLKKANEKRLMRKGQTVKLDRTGRIERSPKTNSNIAVTPIIAPEIIRPKVNKTSDVELILGMITDWMDTKGHLAPMEGEIRVFRKYLLRCVETSTGGLGGIEDASRVLSWWRDTCRRRFASDRMSELSVAWRGVFQQVKADVDEIVERRLGAGLAL